ncbi:CGNR zinc finger domain-containing protein [Actinacidiphila yanglinensis]
MVFPSDDWSTRHSVAATARRTAELVNALAVDEQALAPGSRAADAGVPGAEEGAVAGGGAADTDGGTDADSAADIRTREALAAVLRAYGEAEPLTFTADDLAGLRAAARRLREVFAAEHADVAADRLNRLLADGAGTFRLTSHGGGTPWHPHLDSDDDAPWAEWFLASSCLALAVLVWDRQRPPGGVCASPGCPRVYVTEGRGPNRRYCSRRCATRERVAAHRARTAQRTSAPSASSPSAPGRPVPRPAGRTPS